MPYEMPVLLNRPGPTQIPEGLVVANGRIPDPTTATLLDSFRADPATGGFFFGRPDPVRPDGFDLMIERLVPQSAACFVEVAGALIGEAIDLAGSVRAPTLAGIVEGRQAPNIDVPYPGGDLWRITAWREESPQIPGRQVSFKREVGSRKASLVLSQKPEKDEVYVSTGWGWQNPVTGFVSSASQVIRVAAPFDVETVEYSFFIEGAIFARLFSLGSQISLTHLDLALGAARLLSVFSPWPDFSLLGGLTLRGLRKGSKRFPLTARDLENRRAPKGFSPDPTDHVLIEARRSRPGMIRPSLLEIYAVAVKPRDNQLGVSIEMRRDRGPRRPSQLWPLGYSLHEGPWLGVRNGFSAGNQQQAATG